MTWPELQNMFRHQYSKIGNTREQLFHAWRSFHYDENVETPDAYVIRNKAGSQVIRLWRCTGIRGVQEYSTK